MDLLHTLLVVCVFYQVEATDVTRLALSTHVVEGSGHSSEISKFGKVVDRPKYSYVFSRNPMVIVEEWSWQMHACLHGHGVSKT